MKLEDAVNLAIDNVVLEGLDDVFDRPLELGFLNDLPFREAVFDVVRRSLSPGGLESLAIGPIQHANVPKSGMYAFRRCAILQPMDLIKYLALVLLVAEPIEANRVPVAEHRILSYRFSPGNGRIFDTAYTLAAFHETARKRAADPAVKVVMKCDIANFYDRLNLHRLESTLLAIGADERVVRTLNELLLYWAKKDSYGLPVGSNASRILAEASLIETDRFLVSIEADFIRFVDDYQFFAPSVTKAQFWLYKMMDRLAQEGMTLNSYKTRVYDAKNVVLFRPGGDEAAGDVARFRPLNPIAMGFYTRVPRRFVLPDTGQITTQPRDAADICAMLLRKDVVEPAEFRELALSLILHRQYSTLGQLPQIIQKHPPYIDYAMGMLGYLKSLIPKAIRDTLARELGKFLYSPQIEIPEWHKIQIVKILGTPEFGNREALLRLMRNMPRYSGSAIGRVLLDSLGNFATRSDALEIRDSFERCDPAEKRAILRISNKVLPEEERRAWGKYASEQVRDDLFAVQYVKPFRAKKR